MLLEGGSDFNQPETEETPTGQSEADALRANAAEHTANAEVARRNDLWNLPRDPKNPSQPQFSADEFMAAKRNSDTAQAEEAAAARDRITAINADTAETQAPQ